MKSCEIEVVTGFLGWGKTSFINSYIDTTSKWDENLIIIENENGKKKLELSELKKRNVKVKYLKRIEEDRLNRILSFYEPQRIIIELNCMRNINEFENSLQNLNTVRKLKVINNIAIIDAISIDMFLKNMNFIIEPIVRGADIIVINNINKVSKEKCQKSIDNIELINSHAHIIENKSAEFLEIKKNAFIKSLWR